MKKNLYILLTLIFAKCNLVNNNQKIDGRIIWGEYQCEETKTLQKGYCIEINNSGELSNIFLWQADSTVIDNVESRIDMYDISNLRVKELFKENSVVLWKKIAISGNGELDVVRNYMFNLKDDYTPKYKIGKLSSVLQSVIVDGKHTSNQYITFDNERNIIMENSDFFLFDINSSDSIFVGFNHMLRLKYIAPYFPSGKMKVIIGNYDQYYNIVDTLTLDTIFAENFTVDIPVNFSKVGENYIRGIIENYEDRIDSLGDEYIATKKSYFTKVFEVYKRN